MFEPNRRMWLLGSEKRELGDRFGDGLDDPIAVVRVVHRRQMRMRVNEPWRERRVAEVDNLSTGRDLGRGSGRYDQRPCHHHDARTPYLATVKDARRLQDDRLVLSEEIKRHHAGGDDNRAQTCNGATHEIERSHAPTTPQLDFC
jgi:hypothetical protein